MKTMFLSPLFLTLRRPDSKRLKEMLEVAVVSMVCTIAGVALRDFDPVHVLMLYFLGTVVMALRYGRGAAVWAVVMSAASFSLFIIPPYDRFEAEDLNYLFPFAVLLVIVVIVGKRHKQLGANDNVMPHIGRGSQALYELANDLAHTRGRDNILQVIRFHVEAHGGKATLWVPGFEGQLFCLTYPELSHDVLELEAATFAYQNARLTGYCTSTLGQANGYYVPMKGAGCVLGVLGFIPDDDQDLSLALKQYLEAVADMAASVLDTVYSPSEEMYYNPYINAFTP